MQIHELTALARQMKASDIHISQGLPLMFRIDGVLREAPVQYDADATPRADRKHAGRGPPRGAGPAPGWTRTLPSPRRTAPAAV